MGEPLTLCPATNVQEAEREVVGDRAARGAFQAELASAQIALLAVLAGVALATGQPQRPRKVDVGPNDRLGVSDLLGDAASLPAQGDRTVGVAKIGHATGQDPQRLGLLRPGTNAWATAIASS